MKSDALTELCRQLYQTMLALVEKDERLQRFSVILSAVFTENINQFEKRCQLLLKQPTETPQNPYEETNEPEIIETNLLNDTHDEKVRNAVETIYNESAVKNEKPMDFETQVDSVVDLSYIDENMSDVVYENVVGQRTQHLVIEAITRHNRRHSTNSQIDVDGSIESFEFQIEETFMTTTTTTESLYTTTKEENVEDAGPSNRKRKLSQQFNDQRDFKRRNTTDECQYLSDTKPVILAEDNGMTSTPKVSDTVKITKKREQNRRKTIESRNELENVVKRNPNTKKACDDQFPVVKYAKFRLPKVNEKKFTRKVSAVEKAMEKRHSSRRKTIGSQSELGNIMKSHQNSTKDCRFPVGTAASSSKANETKSAPKESAKEIAMKKRHSNIRKTIGSRSELKTLAKPAHLKNTNRKMHAKNELYRTLCQLCNLNERYLVNHYVNQHPDSEVFISRPSPKMAKQLRLQKEQFDIARGKISGFCYFCEDTKCMYKHKWGVHILSHTGEKEKMFHCKKCFSESKRKIDHKGCDDEPINIFDTNSCDGSLAGFMCTECNYMQIKRERMVKHLRKQHQYTEITEGIQYENVVLVPDPLPVKSVFQSKEYSYIAPVKIYKCAICARKYKSADEFEKHFDHAHIQSVTAYKCVCGENLELEHITLTSGFILAHLQLHDAALDLYRCWVCDNSNNDSMNFTNKREIHDHLLNEHLSSQFKYQNIQRNRNEKETTISEITLKNIVCNVCKDDLKCDQFSVALEHFDNKHPNDDIDLNLCLSKKTSRMAKNQSDITATVWRAEDFRVTINKF